MGFSVVAGGTEVAFEDVLGAEESLEEDAVFTVTADEAGLEEDAVEEECVLSELLLTADDESLCDEDARGPSVTAEDDDALCLEEETDVPLEFF